MKYLLILVYTLVIGCNAKPYEFESTEFSQSLRDGTYVEKDIDGNRYYKKDSSYNLYTY